ncbi:MAG: sulfatase [Planctomycetes bacterium]|nr:sulfatase [Planctomycetota bacterium]
MLVTLDTTNPGALGCYSGRAGLTPHLDALAAEGVLYENARSVAPLTLPSHASMMTGLWPPRHTLRDNGLRALPESAETLAEAARARGYQTAACVAAVVLGESYGLDQGFDVYDAPHGAGPGHGHVLERSSAEVTAAALRWLDGRDRARPFFLWVHYFDAHAPYDPAPEFLARAQALGEARFPAYLGEVAQVDDAVGALLARLRAEGLLEHTLVAVVGDHGESLGRHGEPTHSLLAYDATIRVPLLLRYPDGYRAGERSAEFVSVADVAPTLLEALDLAPGGALDGRSLYRRAVPPGRGVYFESSYGWLNYGWSPLSGWASAEGTYLHSSAPELFPGPAGTRGEERWAAEPALAARLLAALEAATAGPALADDGAAVDARASWPTCARWATRAAAASSACRGLQPSPASTRRARTWQSLAAFYEASLAAARTGASTRAWRGCARSTRPSLRACSWPR